MLVETTKHGVIHYVVGDYSSCDNTSGFVFSPKQILDSHKNILIVRGDHGFSEEYDFHFKNTVEDSLGYKLAVQNGGINDC